MRNSVLWRSRVSCCILIFSFLCMHLMFPSAKAVGQTFRLFGCFDGDACDQPGGGDNVVNALNVDTGQGFSLTGELTYYANASPGGGITTQLSPVAGVCLTNASITYDATNPGPAVHEELDLIYFELPNPLDPLLRYTTIGSYDGFFNNTAALGNRVFSMRTVANGGLVRLVLQS